VPALQIPVQEEALGVWRAGGQGWRFPVQGKYHCMVVAMVMAFHVNRAFPFWDMLDGKRDRL
jgi:hypothetical protein